MKYFFLILIGIVFITFSCKNNDNDDESFNATVLMEGIDCNDSFLIQFNDDVTGLPENDFDKTFYEINLPNEYKIENLDINVTFREPTNTELMVCTSLGTAYPQIYIIGVE
mgnify:CR=1 FL=1